MSRLRWTLGEFWSLCRETWKADALRRAKYSPRWRPVEWMFSAVAYGMMLVVLPVFLLPVMWLSYSHPRDESIQ